MRGQREEGGADKKVGVGCGARGRGTTIAVGWGEATGRGGRAGGKPDAPPLLCGTPPCEVPERGRVWCVRPAGSGGASQISTSYHGPTTGGGRRRDRGVLHVWYACRGVTWCGGGGNEEVCKRQGVESALMWVGAGRGVCTRPGLGGLWFGWGRAGTMQRFSAVFQETGVGAEKNEGRRKDVQAGTSVRPVIREGGQRRGVARTPAQR